MTPPAARFLDPGAGEWAFDASSLISAAVAPGMLSSMVIGFNGRAHITDEVLQELDKGTSGRLVRAISWFSERRLTTLTEISEMGRLHRRFTRDPHRDRGEAATLIAATHDNWTIVLDDGTAYAIACDLAARATRTPQLIVSMVRAEWWNADDAWKAYVALIEQRGRRLGPIPWSGRIQFEALCAVATFDP